MVGKLHKSWPGGHVYMLVAVENFTKWIEAATVTTQDSTSTINFIKLIVFCFGVPHNIITDNGTNIMSKEFKNYYRDQFCLRHTPVDKRASRKGQWFNIQWYKKEVANTT
jgi:hypothetical protein